MNEEDTQQASSQSNQDLLAGLRTGDNQVNAAPVGAPQGPLPWDSKPSVPASPTPTGNPAVGGQGSSRVPVDQVVFTETVQVPSSTASPVVGAPATPGPPPGIYVANPGELRLWNGHDWDPRPVAATWTRVWCWFIDNLMSFVFGLVVAFLVTIPLLSIAGDSEEAIGLAFSVILAFGIVAYFALSYGFWGRTLGMLIGGINVVAIDTGRRPSWGKSWLRALVLCVAEISGILALIWFAITTGSPTKQGPHDRAAKTIVVRSRI